MGKIVIVTFYLSLVMAVSVNSQTSNRELKQLAESVREDLISDILPFWQNKMTDNIHGGFYGRMDGNNKIYPDAEKGGILNARILWTFSAAFRELKDSSYLRSAKRAFDFILKDFIDTKYGGTFRSVTAKGEPSDLRKQTYSQAFFIYALSEYFLATGDKRALDEAKNIFSCVEKYCYDSSNNGYFEVFSRDWKRTGDLLIGEKDTNDQKTMNTHLHLLEAYTNLYRAWPEKLVADRLRNMIGLFVSKIIDRETGHLIVFMNEKWQKTSYFNSYGHDIEASWLLQEAAASMGDKKIKDEVGQLIIPVVKAAAEGLQPDGSLIYEKNILTGEANSNRDWWPQAETVVGFVNAWQITGDMEYLQKAVKCWEYIENNFIDKVNGEWFNSISENGEVNRRADKAGFWKCPYHNGRMCIEIIRRSN
jgi:cellobiose epimerase